MPWKSRRNYPYYYRSVRRDGRVVTQYFGRHASAEAQAAADASRRAARKAENEALRRDREQLAPLEAAVDRLDRDCETLARLALFAAGYHRHKQGEWRKRRNGA